MTLDFSGAATVDTLDATPRYFVMAPYGLGLGAKATFAEPLQGFTPNYATTVATPFYITALSVTASAQNASATTPVTVTVTVVRIDPTTGVATDTGLSATVEAPVSTDGIATATSPTVVPLAPLLIMPGELYGVVVTATSSVTQTGTGLSVRAHLTLSPA